MRRRTVPDGSSFAWQHWTHTFGFAIIAGEGDWRAAGFPCAAQEAAHPLRARPVPATAGALPHTLSLIAVEPAEVVLTAAKPAGNPLASGSVITPSDAITLRVLVKTQPMEQWAVARELRQRIKARFDHEGIEIPFPQRVVWHREGRPHTGLDQEDEADDRADRADEGA